MDETWKLSKRRSKSVAGRSSSSGKHCISKQQEYYNQEEPHSLTKSYSQRPSTSSSRSPPLSSKSFSHKSSKKASSSTSSNNARYSYINDHPDLTRSVSERGSSSSSIGKKCGSLAREQKARFYIIRRCVAMLVCWHEHVEKEEDEDES